MLDCFHLGGLVKHDPVSSKWGALEPELETTYFGFPPLRQYQIKSAFGEELAQIHKDNPDWAEDIVISTMMAKKGGGIQKALSLCCGFGKVEIVFASRLPHLKQMLGLDLAEKAIEIAKQRAKEAGLGHVLDFAVADLDNYEWPQDEYDLIIANGALHHLTNIEAVVKGVHRALKPGGLFYSCEVVGAKWQDHEGRQLKLINEVAYMLPENLRRSRRTTPWGYVRDAFTGRLTLPSVKPHWPRYVRVVHKVLSGIAAVRGKNAGARPILWEGNKAWLLKSDPSEGISSDRVMPSIRALFPDMKVFQFGGSILAYALDENFYRNYDGSNRSHVKLLEELIELETGYIASGEVPIEHAVIVASKSL